MNVLSLFNGSSGGMMALEDLGIKVDNYFSSEIDKYANQVSQFLYPQIQQMGDIHFVNADCLPKIDLVLGGSPCQGFSFAGKQLNFNDPRSKLFFEYVRILNEVKKVNPNVKFLLENVRMKKEYLDAISELLGEKPVLINSSLVSAQNRQRYYWTNIDNISQPKDKKILLKDVLDIEFDACLMRDKSKTIRIGGRGSPAGSKQEWDNVYKPLKSVIHKNVLRDNSLCLKVGEADIKGFDCVKRVYSPLAKAPTLTTCSGGHQEPKVSQDNINWRKLTPRECFRLQTVKEGLIDKILQSGVSNSQLYKIAGNGWTIKVISHILKRLD
jgi:DNA-cytosine methyltransferase